MQFVPESDPAFAAFIDAILKTPEDVTARLAFADFLDERGDPRGPLLRVVPAVLKAAGPYRRTGAVRNKYPEERPPDILVPKLFTRHGVNGAGRLLSIALIRDYVATRGKQSINVRNFETSAVMAELRACNLLIGPAWRSKLASTYVLAHVNLTTLARSELKLGYNPIPIWNWTSGAFGTFVLTAQRLEELHARRLRKSLKWASYTQFQQHFRARTLRMRDAWAALTPWIDGKRNWDLKEEVKPGKPPTSNQHKKYLVSSGKIPCDHKSVSPLWGWRAPVLSAYGAKSTAGRKRFYECALCGHVRRTAPRG